MQSQKKFEKEEANSPLITLEKSSSKEESKEKSFEQRFQEYQKIYDEMMLKCADKSLNALVLPKENLKLAAQKLMDQLEEKSKSDPLASYFILKYWFERAWSPSSFTKLEIPLSEKEIKAECRENTKSISTLVLLNLGMFYLARFVNKKARGEFFGEVLKTRYRNAISSLFHAYVFENNPNSLLAKEIKKLFKIMSTSIYPFNSHPLHEEFCRAHNYHNLIEGNLPSITKENVSYYISEQPLVTFLKKYVPIQSNQITIHSNIYDLFLKKKNVNDSKSEIVEQKNNANVLSTQNTALLFTNSSVNQKKEDIQVEQLKELQELKKLAAELNERIKKLEASITQNKVGRFSKT